MPVIIKNVQPVELSPQYYIPYARSLSLLNHRHGADGIFLVDTFLEYLLYDLRSYYAFTYFLRWSELALR